MKLDARDRAQLVMLAYETGAVARPAWSALTAPGPSSSRGTPRAGGSASEAEAGSQPFAPPADDAMGSTGSRSSVCTDTPPPSAELTAAIGLVAGSVLVAGAAYVRGQRGAIDRRRRRRRAPDGARHTMLHNILELHRVAGEFVGATIALRDADGTVTEAVAGTPTVDPASGPVDPDVPWNIGSATKSFVAVVVLQLADEGRLDLDDGIDGYLPDLADAARITPRELLQHTSGLGEYLDQPARRRRPPARVDPGRADRRRRGRRPRRRTRGGVPLRQHQLHRAGRDHRTGHRSAVGRRGARPHRRAARPRPPPARSPINSRPATSWSTGRSSTPPRAPTPRLAGPPAGCCRPTATCWRSPPRSPTARCCRRRRRRR